MEKVKRAFDLAHLFTGTWWTSKERAETKANISPYLQGAPYAKHMK